MLLWVGRLDKEFRPESDMEQDWLLRALRPPLYELRFPSKSFPFPLALGVPLLTPSGRSKFKIGRASCRERVSSPV